MATPTVLTPVKSRTNGLFNTRTAGGRLALTPSPKTPTRTPTRDVAGTHVEDSIHGNGVNLMSRFSRSISKTHVRDSPKSNIARSTKSPRHLELGLSDFTLTGTSAATSNKHSPSRRKAAATRPAKVRISYKDADRFIPNRTASEALSATGRLDLDARPKSSAGDGSSVLAGAASAFEIGRGSEDEADLGLALDGLSLNDNDSEDKPSYSKPTPDTVAYESSIASACDISLNTRILAFKPAAPESSKPIDLRSQYNRPLKPASTGAQFRRRVLTAPERVLDAPGLVDDYYLNLLDWSSGNQVAIGLDRNVYVWSADTGSVASLLQCNANTSITSVKWSGDGAYVGVGLGTGEVQIWDVEEGTKLRSMYGHDSRVGVMGWNKHILSTGSRTGAVFNHDVRIAEHKVAELISHTGEVCGLEWRSDGAQLATGANDNLVSIWDARSLAAPKFTKTNHRAAVKALAWCPWQLNLLATGGGSHDRHIHFWNSTTGARTNSIDTGSQVTGLRWSTQYKEILSTSGFPDNSLSLWSWPSLVKNIEIPAHESRVLHSCLSPDGQMLATAAADESLKFWKVFEKKAGSGTVSGVGANGNKAKLAMSATIR
jgi:cell division cycle 20, cofactor of APC complex